MSNLETCERRLYRLTAVHRACLIQELQPLPRNSVLQPSYLRKLVTKPFSFPAPSPHPVPRKCLKFFSWMRGETAGEILIAAVERNEEHTQLDGAMDGISEVPSNPTRNEM